MFIVKDNITIFKGVSNMTTEMNDVTIRRPNQNPMMRTLWRCLSIY